MADGPAQSPSNGEAASSSHDEQDAEVQPRQDDGPRLTVAGIGASAGGLEPISRFLGALPTDLGIAYVVITHLSPEHRSALPELLANRTEMPVLQVTSTVPIEADHVYVIPPDRELIATDSSLSTQAFEEPRGQRSPVDHFFRSLALRHGKGFAVILSGNGSDGSLGIRSIKEAGGIILVQDPREATFGGMPRSAIATGLADLVLPVGELAERFVEIARRRHGGPGALADDEKPDDGDQGDLRRILIHLQRVTGHDFTRYKRSTVLRRLDRRMQITRVQSLGEYFRLLASDSQEVQRFFQELLISVTSFFRDPDAFAALERRVIDPLLDSLLGHGNSRPLRVWVPGCATGEEAYSIAILLLEGAARRELRLELEMFASDLDERALAIAREGRFPEAIEADLPPARLERFFIHQDDHYEARAELRQAVLFAAHDLLRDPPFRNMDLISCRNLLIYLDADLQRQVFALLHYALRPGGHLLLGSAEPGDREYFREVDRDHRIYQRKEILRESIGELPTLMLRTHPSIVGFEPRARRPARQATEAHRRTLEELAPPSILVDADSQVLHLSERAGRFLQPAGGPFSAELTDLVRPELAGGLRSALFRVFRYETPVLTPAVPVPFDGKARRVSLQVLPRLRHDGEERLALVVFLEGGEEPGEEPEVGADDDGSLGRLREELRESQERLRVTREEFEAANEELRASNEELQSINEEYRSTSEELETSKEELQSINEELHTVNSELKHRLEEISRAHSDLENLIAAAEIGTLFLDRELRIERFSATLPRLFHVTQSDVGRPIADFTHRLVYEELLADCRRVLAELVTVDREVTSEEGRWYAVRLRPYRTLDDRIDGVVLTFFEITDRKRVEEDLLEREAQLELAHQVAQVGWWSVDQETGRIGWSDSARRLLGVEEGRELETIEELAADLVAEADRSELVRAFSRAGRDRSEVDLEFRIVHPDRGERCLLSRGRSYPGGNQRRLLAVVIDVTDQKRIHERLEALRRDEQRHAAELDRELEARSRELRESATKVTRAEQEERRQLGQILHDDLQQQLYGVRLRITDLLRSAESPAAADVERLTEIYDQLAEAVAITRRLAARLSLPGQGTDLHEVLDSLAQQMESLHELAVEVRHDGALPKTGESLRIVVHQIVRELLFNVVKHSGVKSAIITGAQQDGCLILTVEDRGVGFDPEVVDRGSGLQTVRRRLELLGGAMEIVSRPGEGARVVVRVALTADSD